MFLLIGHHTDPCVRRVGRLLRERDEPVLTLAEPLVGDSRFGWQLSTERSRSVLRHGGETILDSDWRGVLVRGAGTPRDAAGWSPEDLAYAQAEGHAAMVAWLRSLPCPVVNTPRAELWFRVFRALPEQQALFRQAGLPCSDMLVANDLAAARSFAERWGGAATYAPLASAARYPLHSEQAWGQVAQVIARMPVCLMAPITAERSFVTYAGGYVAWGMAPLDQEQRRAVAAGLGRLAGLLGVELLQIELAPYDGGVCCVSFTAYPQFAAHPEDEQERLAAAVVALLSREQPLEVLS